MVFYMGTASVGTFVDISVGVQIIVAAVMGGRRTDDRRARSARSS